VTNIGNIRTQMSEDLINTKVEARNITQFKQKEHPVVVDEDV
jgi:hypothetical protein